MLYSSATTIREALKAMACRAPPAVSGALKWAKS